MERCKCPYCMNDIGINDLKFYIRKEMEPASPLVKAFLTPEKRSPEEDPFFRFWTAYRKKVNPSDVSRRIVKSESDLLRAQTDFAARAELLRQKPVSAADDSGPDTVLQSHVICEIQKVQSTDLPKYIIREDGLKIAVTRIACPGCYNVLPEEIFKLPMIKVALAANTFGGKTCLSLSWFRGLYNPDGSGLNSHLQVMAFGSMLEADRGMDDEFIRLLNDFRNEDICPQGTRKEFIPPVFLKVNYRGKQEAIVGIYDAAGEILTDSLKDDELVSYMNYMDGIIYMIEPSKTSIGTGAASKHLFDNGDSKRFYAHARVLSPEEQCRVQMEDYRKQQLGELMAQQMTECDARATAIKNCSLEVLAALRGYVDDKVLKQQNVALAISKCDELRGNHEIQEYNTGGMLFMDERTMMPGQEKMREKQLERLFREKVFNLDLFENVFKDYSLHMIAALGCATRVCEKEEKDSRGNLIAGRSRLVGRFEPIRPEEPLLTLISKYAKEHGWSN